MSKLDDLIENFCINGVEFLKLGQIEDLGYVKLGRGNVISKQDMNFFPGDYPVYSSSAINNGLFGNYGKYMFDDERITWSVDGGGKLFYREKHRFSVTNVSGWIKLDNPEYINLKYLYYSLINSWSQKTFDYVKKAHPSVIREEYIVPLPPLLIQQEIVRILDSFTTLEAELKVELDARKRQYEYYRDFLLAFKDDTMHIALGTLCKIGDGLHGTPIYNNKGAYAFINGNNLNGKRIIIDSNTKLVDEEEYRKHGIKFNEQTILMSINGTIGSLAIYDCEKIVLSKSVAYFCIQSDKLNLKFLYYMFQTNFARQYFSQSLTGSTIKNLGLKALRGFEIPLPSMEIQRRVVFVLEYFDMLCNDTTLGLPAEIKARRIQYEYYRDKLLTFKEVNHDPV